MLPALLWSGGPGGVNATIVTVNQYDPSLAICLGPPWNMLVTLALSAENVPLSLPLNFRVALKGVPSSLVESCKAREKLPSALGTPTALGKALRISPLVSMSGWPAVAELDARKLVATMSLEPTANLVGSLVN